MKKNEYLVDTDILLDHLKDNRKEVSTILENLMQSGLCFTTVINAAELFMEATNDNENASVKNLLGGLKVLGIPARYSLYISKYYDHNRSLRDLIFMTTAALNRLTIASVNNKKYQNSTVSLIDVNSFRG